MRYRTTVEHPFKPEVCGFRIDMVTGKSIKVTRLENVATRPVHYYSDFEIGGSAKYAHDGIHKLGTILSIAPQIITIQPDRCGEITRRLKLPVFALLNYNFDIDLINEENAKIRNSIHAKLEDLV